MANTNAPVASTYKTITIPLAGEATTRNAVLKKDRRTVNLMPEIVKSQLTSEQNVTLKGRPGTVIYSALPPSSGVARGTFYWNGTIFSVIDNVLYSGTTALITLATSTGDTGFTTFNGTSQQSLVFLDGTNGYVITSSATYTQITDPDFPTPHCPSPVSQDGYLLVADTTDNIYNSDLQAPLNWTAGNFIEAEMYPDKIVKLVRMKNYTIALGSDSMEFFFNPGTIVSGSPFQRNDSLAKRIGTLAYGSVATEEDQMVFMGVSESSGLTIFMLDGSTLTEIADYTVKQCLENLGSATVQAYILRIGGHKLYVLNMFRTGFERTFVYDFMAQMWVEWQFLTNNYFPFNFCTTNLLKETILQYQTTGSLYKLDPTVFTDSGTPIYCILQTSKVDGNTIRYKDFDRLGMMYDSEISPLVTTVEWSDDDYNTWTSRVVNFTPTTAYTAKLGKARRRAFRITVVLLALLRIESLELDLNVMGV